ncbi:hypothetical protein OS122_01575 [Mycolicibacterium mucogenicum]|uniref:hypothetical protein n=1 Tax=Mycolicibacterium mucogenicum TaxID=56689 RepID=UPI00226AA279|nr:hypothetical protein [Mycolicibacterium mucogenicum]MCX8559587.1 hypothetical protein [Mycolicibacterium mucogenicum]
MRVLLFVAGLVLAGYGAVLVAENPPVILMRMAVWALVAVAVHDVVFAPLCVALGFTGRRVLPASWQAPVAVAGLCTVVLALLAIPVLDKPGMRPDNMTVLDRDYHAGLWIWLVLVWACVPGYLVVRRLLPVRQNKVVEDQGADDVGGQPPTL